MRKLVVATVPDESCVRLRFKDGDLELLGISARPDTSPTRFGKTGIMCVEVEDPGCFSVYFEDVTVRFKRDRYVVPDDLREIVSQRHRGLADAVVGYAHYAGRRLHESREQCRRD